MIEVRFHRLAAREYRAARMWYSARSNPAATRFRLAVDDAVQRLTGSPDTQPNLSDNYHWVRVRKFPYILVYCHLTNQVWMIVAVAHTSRRARYWKRRR